MLLACASAGTASAAPPAPDEPWRLETSSDASAPLGRHEAAGIAYEGKLYLLGGRPTASGQRVDVYDPVARTWTASTPMPVDLHHFQPVLVGAEVWIVGAFTGGYPDEIPVADVHVFDIATLSWRIAGQVPEARRRGSAGVARGDDGALYVYGGNTLGHRAGAVAWLDRLDPATMTWTALPDGPRPRDHFGIGHFDGRLVAAGGRATAMPNPFANTIAETDVYSIADGTWSTGSAILTPRAGAFTVQHEGELLLVGGEISGDEDALAVAEAYDADGDAWRALQPLSVGRHSGGAGVMDDRLHVVAGSRIRGGDNSTVHESLALDGDAPDPAPDADADGLSDADEAELGTDPAVPDTDGDTLEDGTEVDLGTDPLLSDTDADGTDDATEVALGTDPLDPDAGGADDGSADGGTDDGTGGGTGSDGGAGDGVNADGNTAGATPDGDAASGRRSGGGGAFGAAVLALLALTGGARRRRGRSARR